MRSLPSWAMRYGIAALAVGSALLAKLLLAPFIGQEQSPFLLFFAAVIASAFFGGLGPGIFAVFLTALASRYFFLPGDSLLAQDWKENVRLGNSFWKGWQSVRSAPC